MRDNARRGATCDARCRNGTRCPRRFVRGECGVASANRGIAAVIRATQVSPLRCGVLARDIAAGQPRGRMGRMRHCGGRCATMPVGAPLVTPGAGTAQGVRGIARGGARSVAGQSRYCDKPSARVHGLNAALRLSSGRHKCRPYAAGCSFAALRQAIRAGAWGECGIAAGRGCQRSTISTTGTVLTNSRDVT